MMSEKIKKIRGIGKMFVICVIANILILGEVLLFFPDAVQKIDNLLKIVGQLTPLLVLITAGVATTGTIAAAKKEKGE